MAAIDERRRKISVSVDAALLHDVAAFLQQHPDLTRSAVIDQALRLWRLRLRDEALMRQYTTPLTPEQDEEQGAWNAFHRMASQTILEQADDRYEA